MCKHNIVGMYLHNLIHVTAYNMGVVYKRSWGCTLAFVPVVQMKMKTYENGIVIDFTYCCISFYIIIGVGNLDGPNLFYAVNLYVNDYVRTPKAYLWGGDDRGTPPTHKTAQFTLKKYILAGKIFFNITHKCIKFASSVNLV